MHALLVHNQETVSAAGDRRSQKKNVLLEKTDSIDAVPEDTGLWKQTAFSDKWWAAKAPVKGTVNTK